MGYTENTNTKRKIDGYRYYEKNREKSEKVVKVSKLTIVLNILNGTIFYTY